MIKSFSLEFFVQDDRFILIVLLIHVKVTLLYVLTELGYALICQVTQKRKCSFENALREKSKSSIRNSKMLSHQRIV